MHGAPHTPARWIASSTPNQQSWHELQALTEAEIAFLEAGGATVISDPGDHVDAIFAQTGPALEAVLP